MVERFNALVDRGDLGYEFEAWFNDRIEFDRSWDVDETKWRFRYRYLPTTNVFGYKIHWPIYMLSRRPDVLVSLYAEPSYLLGWVIAKLRGSRTAFWCEVTFDAWITRRLWKEKLKKIIFPKVDVVLGSGNDGKNYAMRYGVRESNALILRHSIDVNFYKSHHKENLKIRNTIRSELHLVGTVFIYVGRLWWGKGINYLLNAFENVQKTSQGQVSLLIVGDGSEEQNLKEICAKRNIKNVVFAGFHQKSDLHIYYSAADVFVFPTLGDPYGLVVDEAMACSLPIISTTGAGEIADRIEQGINGYIVQPKDENALTESMLRFVNDGELCTAMGRNSAKMIEGNTPEKWADTFNNIVSDLLAKK